MDRPAKSVATNHPLATRPAFPPKAVHANIAAPNIPPAQAPSFSAAPTPAPTVTAPPPGSVEALCTNLATQLQANDTSTIIDTFGDPANAAQVPPNLGQYFVDSLNQPTAGPRVALWIRALKELPNLTPILSDNGDTATYDVSSLTGADPQSPISKLVMKKRNGQWYFTVTSLLIGAAGFGVTNPPPPQ